MNVLEQRLADRFRANGDRLLSSLPDWPNTEITVGDEHLRITAERLNPGPHLPKVFRQTIRLPFAGLMRAQETLGIETLGEAIIIDAQVLAHRKADGAVIGLSAMKRWYDQFGRSHRVMMRLPSGYPLLGRWSDAGQKQCLAYIRRGYRSHVKTFGVIRHANLTP